VRIVRYEQDWKGHWGIVDGETVYELRGSVYDAPRPGDRVGMLSELKLLAPCTPETIWSNGANYPSRCDERGFSYPTVPAVAVVTGSTICGTAAEVRIPEHEVRLEYGVELGIVIKKDCHDVEEAEAADYVLGYTGLNNIWVKDQGEAKAYVRPLRVYDNHCPTGLVLDTEFDWRDKPVRLWVDGELRQDDNTSTMFFTPEYLISFISKQVTMKQGDLIMTGSPGGIEGKWIRFGQTVEFEVADLGRVRNRIVRVDTAAVSYVISLKKWVEQRQGAGELVPTSF
jgi:2-keto-4-pentenoate hydratase/2-oxohepta-3-ene-1,7-dioic acid hydratase in catechol pathway